MTVPEATDRTPDAWPDHIHRHLHLSSGQFWWHRHEHDCDIGNVELPGGDFNALHHHAPAQHDGLPDDVLGEWTVDGTNVANLHDVGWRCP